MMATVERDLWAQSRDEFRATLKFIPAVQQDAYRVSYYLRIPFRQVVRIRGVDISDAGIRIRQGLRPWPEEQEIIDDMISLKARLIDIATRFPAARVFEAQKPLLKACYDLRNGYRQAQARQRHAGVTNSREYLDDDGKLPNFLVIGVPKAATTWIYECFRAHPDVFVPEKELEFFSSYRYHYGLEWYKRHFSSWTTEKVAGDVSIGYFQSEEAPRRIFESFDGENVKLILLLREPIDRALSFYRMRVMKGNVLSSFEDSLKIPYYRSLYIDSSHYDEHYQSYLRYFRKDQILILLHDDIKRNPTEALHKVFDFMGVNGDIAINPARKKNVSKALINVKRHRIFVHIGIILQIFLPWLAIGWKLRMFLLGISKKINFSSEKEQEIPPGILDKLKQEFLPSVLRLEELSDLNLSDWK